MMKGSLFFVAFMLIISISAMASVTIPVTKLSKIAGVNLASGNEQEWAIENNNTNSGTVLLFLSAACPCSNSHVPYFIEVAKKFPKFQFLAIHSNINEGAKETKEYFDQIKLPFAVVQDNHSRLANQINATNTPFALVLSNKGEILYRGGVSNSKQYGQKVHLYLEAVLKDLEAGREIKIKERPVAGCQLQREKI
ncbi:MAG: redoxin domain-containing protein [Oligoflexia bacterium]|nr:redoxin domain-containing protein [Oligoflexia bacterium]